MSDSILSPVQLIRRSCEFAVEASDEADWGLDRKRTVRAAILLVRPVLIWWNEVSQVYLWSDSRRSGRAGHRLCGRIRL